MCRSMGLAWRGVAREAPPTSHQHARHAWERNVGRHVPRVRLGVEDEDDVGGDDARQLVPLPLVGDLGAVLPPLPAGFVRGRGARKEHG